MRAPAEKPKGFMEMFEGDSADMFTDKIMIVSVGWRADPSSVHARAEFSLSSFWAL